MRHPGVFAPPEEPDDDPFRKREPGEIPSPAEEALVSVHDPQIVVFDIETRYSSHDVDGWANIHKMGMSVGVVWDSRTAEFSTYTQEQANELCGHLMEAPVVVGFNQKKFDYIVLSGIAGVDLSKNTVNIDILEDLHARTGRLVSLNSVANETIGAQKSADGLLAVKWWKEGMIEKLTEYCIQDVEVTRDIFLYGLRNGHIKCRTSSSKLQIPVNWASRVKSH